MLFNAIALPAFDLCLDRLDSFARAGVVWLGCSDPPSGLRRLAGTLGFGQPAPGPFVARVSIARHCTAINARAVAPIRWRVDTFALIASGSDGRPGSYRTVRQWRLGDPAPV